MSVLKPRNRLVYFRVSEDEFRQFNHICETTGARSVSDLARSAMQRLVQDGGGGGNCLSDQLRILETIVNDLNSKVENLSASLRENAAAAAGLGAIKVAHESEPVSKVE